MTSGVVGDWRRVLAALHRYLGIGLCLLFAMWFASGTVMLFRPFPALSETQRFSCLEPIDLPKTEVHPSILERASTESTSRVRLTSLTGRAVVHVHGLEVVDSYWADTGAGPIYFDAAHARRVAEQCGQSPALAVQTVVDDQWTVHEGFSGHRPLHRVRIDDRSGTVLYVSSRTGEVVQLTTRAVRGWNWIGSVPHWIYFSAIRRHWGLWDTLVWWVAGAGTLGVFIGLVLGLVRWRRSTHSRVSPYRGAMYWHHVSGLGCGFIVLTWIFSGALSMDHGRLFSTGEPTATQRSLVAGTVRFEGEPRMLLSGPPTGPIKEIEWLRVAGRAYLTFRTSPWVERIAAAADRDLGAAPTAFPATVLAGVQSRLMPGARLTEHRVLEAYDRYYYARDHAPRPLPILRLRFDDPAATWFHIDLATGTILERIDASRRAYRFWFNALHSHDLPWMLDRPVLRRTWMVILCTAGFLFSCNATWVAWKRLRRRPPRGALRDPVAGG